MPSQQEVRWSQLKIGVIVLVSAVILTTLLFLMTSASGFGFFSRKLTLTCYFENSSGLKDGAAVNLEGVTIGNVKTIVVVTAPERKRTPVQVVMKIDSKWQPSLHTDSTVTLASVGILGDTVVNISSAYATGPEARDGTELKAKKIVNIQDMEDASKDAIDQLNQTLTKVNGMVDDLKSGKGTIGQLLTNPELFNKFSATTNDLDIVVKKFNSSDNSIGKVLNDNGAMYDHLNSIVANADQIAGDLQAGKGSAGKLLKDPAMADNATAALKNLNAILADAQAGKGGLGMALKDPAFAKNLSDSVAKVDDLLAGIDAGKGTLGELVKNNSTSTDLNTLLTNSSDLVKAIREDPKKYLTIQLKIF
jgi:phospholipid/cholesterol/gamma-HCH transport system substrate-binding protein